MVGSQGKSRAQTRAEDRIAAIRNGANRRNAATKRSGGVPDIYQDMLFEAVSSAEPHGSDSRPQKRQRLEEEPRSKTVSTPIPSRKRPVVNPQSAASSVHQDASESESAQRPQQIIEDSGDSDEDFDWEEVAVKPSATLSNSDYDIGDISVELGPKKVAKKTPTKRKPATTAEKLLRMAVHEAHLLFLLFHVHVRNSWCNSDAVQVRYFITMLISGIHADRMSSQS